MIRDLLRQSPLSAHAVPLSELESSPALADLERASRADVASALRSSLASLASYQVVMGHRAHRRSWRPSSGVAVVAWSPGDVRAQVSLPGGETSFVALRDVRPLPFATLLISPRENFAVRVKIQAAPTGDVIEDADDGAYGIRAEGPFALPLVGCEETGTCGGNGGGQANSTRITAVLTHGVCDNGLCLLGDTNELRFRTRVPPASQWSSGVMVEGIGATEAWENLNIVISSQKPINSTVIPVDVFELDGWPMPDDEFLWNPGPNHPANILWGPIHLGWWSTNGGSEPTWLNCRQGQPCAAPEVRAVFAW
ncbi:MAG: hypothetical protein NW201_09715 [Gemmatimonadales bacterium]|nr:hypothetical protein [Gemmatimonadales bacterium]